MDVADAAMEKGRVLSELVREINATPSAVDLGEKKTIIPSPPQVFWAIVNSLPRLPAIPTILRPSTAATAAEVKHPSAEAFEEGEEVIVAPAEVAEEFPSPQTDIVPLVYE